MKQSFKKVVSILLVAMLLVSAMPTIFVTTANAVEGDTEWVDLVFSAGNKATSEGDGSVKMYNDAVKTEENSNGWSYFLLEKTDGTIFRPVAETQYTIIFEYKKMGSNSGVNAGQSEDYFMVGAANGADSRGTTVSEVRLHLSNSILNEWVPVTYSFTANDATRGLQIQLRNWNCGLNGDPTVYVKNIKIRANGTMTGTVLPAVEKDIDVDAYINDDGTITAGTQAANEDSGKLKYTKTAEGLLISCEDNANTSSVYPTNGYYTENAATVPIEHYYLFPERKYNVHVEYKLVKRGKTTADATMTLRLAFGSGTANSKEIAYLKKEDTATNIYQQITTAAGSDSSFDRVYSSSYNVKTTTTVMPILFKMSVWFNGDFELLIKSIKLTAVEETVYEKDLSPAGNAVALTVTDGDATYTVPAWKGDRIEDWYTAKNADSTKKFAGWYTEDGYTNKVETVPSDANTCALFAKYEDVIEGELEWVDLDYNAGTNAALESDGSVKMYTETVKTDTDSNGYSYFLLERKTAGGIFKPVNGEQYTIAFEYKKMGANSGKNAGTSEDYFQIGKANSGTSRGNTTSTVRLHLNNSILNEWVPVTYSFTADDDTRGFQIILRSWNCGVNGDPTVYIRNIKIRAKGAVTGVTTPELYKELDVDAFIDDTGAMTDTNALAVTYDDFKFSKDAEKGLLISNTAGTTSSFYAGDGYHSTSAAGFQFERFYIFTGKSYTVELDYEVKSKADGTTLRLGFGTGPVNTNEIAAINGFDAEQIIAESGSFSGSFSTIYDGRTTSTVKPRILKLYVWFNGDFEIYIKSIRIKSAEQTVFDVEPVGNAVKLEVNDGTGAFATISAWKGDNVADWYAGHNTDMKLFKGLYEDAGFTTEATVIPKDLEGNTYTIYGKYAYDAEFDAVSNRDPQGEGEAYLSAGIRFKATLANALIRKATRIEYFFVPKLILEESSAASVGAYVTSGKTDYLFSGVAKDESHGNGYGNIYDSAPGDTRTYYQAVLTGLTQEGSNRHLKNLVFNVAIAITVDGATEYVECPSAWSYNTIAAEAAQ